jgi:hypothetical protein
MHSVFGRHSREFQRALDQHKWEQHANGILFPAQHALAAGEYIITNRKTGELIERVQNLLPTEGLAFLLNLLGNHAAIPSALYIALHANTTTPLAAHVALTYTATFAEIVSGSEGYTQANRVAWVSATATVGAIHNNASPAVFTIITASTLTVNGVAMLTAQAKGATTGTAISIAKFSASRTFSNTDEFDVKYQLGLTSP